MDPWNVCTEVFLQADAVQWDACDISVAAALPKMVVCTNTADLTKISKWPSISPIAGTQLATFSPTHVMSQLRIPYVTPSNGK